MSQMKYGKSFNGNRVGSGWGSKVTMSKGEKEKLGKALAEESKGPNGPLHGLSKAEARAEMEKAMQKFMSSKSEDTGQ